ncbi:MAG: TetR/AcrR family transcriptional regulator [Hydrogenovibrio sp.]|nr:TetR/AcrR family transcriptional regulator [Hydrogenovibrio sp.]
MTQTTETNNPIECPCTTKRGIARHQKLLEVAGETFLKNGYSGASVNEIVKKAGGSLGTLYQLFGNKLGLFEAVLKVKTSEVFDEFDSDAVWTEDIEASLLKFGRKLQRVALSGDGIALYRLVLAENSLDQEHIQKIFYTYGPQRATDILSSYFAKLVKNKRMKPMDCKLAAYQLLEMIKAPFYLRFMLGESIPEEELEAGLQQSVKLFLNGALTQEK